VCSAFRNMPIQEHNKENDEFVWSSFRGFVGWRSDRRSIRSGVVIRSVVQFGDVGIAAMHVQVPAIPGGE
jgi:hypothetical protein